LVLNHSIMINTVLTIILSLFLASLAGESQAQTLKILTLADAQRVADAAEAKARENNWNVVIAILDGGGNLVLLRRMDGTQMGSIDLAQQKAQTAFKFKRATKVFEDAIKAGNIHFLSMPGVVAVEGGLPILHEGQVVGAIGISGVTAAQDGIIATAGLEAF
jgi:glc operon protein GlcG